jgi:hypothetical protein
MTDICYDLSQYGWDGCVISSDLKDICACLPTYRHLKSLKPVEKYGGTELYVPHRFFKHAGQEYMPVFKKGALSKDGGYAQFFKGKRAIFHPHADERTGVVNLKKASNFSEIGIKEIVLNITADEDAAPPRMRSATYNEEINAILYEAFLHGLLHKTLEQEGFPSAVPRMYDVVAFANDIPDITDPTTVEKIWITMEFINGRTLEKYLQDTLTRIPIGPIGPRVSAHLKMEKENELIILDFCIQLAFYLHILQTKLRFNHRDMKVNNVYVRHHEAAEGWSQTLTIPTLGSWKCRNDIVLIDFGFSCISCGTGFPNPRATLVGAGSWFKNNHDCLKYGRDLAQFLYCLHCTFPLHQYIGQGLFDIIHSALLADKSGKLTDLMMGVSILGIPIPRTELPKTIVFNEGIYTFLRDNAVDVPGCHPYTFLKTIADYIHTNVRVALV